jgi:hypothetical protein
MMTNPVMCVYCGVRPATENEHVIGNVFYVSFPKFGVTVPSCSDCNRKRGDGGPRDLHLDEEYMRNALCLAEGTQDHPIAATLYQEKVVRSFRRSIGLAASVLNASGFTELKTEEGLFEPYTSPCFYPEVPRLQRVLRKITRGLYYWAREKRLPDDYSVLVNPMVRPRELPMLTERLDTIGAFGPVTLDEYGVFEFMVAMEKGKTARTHWLMRFYGWAVFHTWTLPTVEVSAGDTGMPSTQFVEIFR